jgi:hypothetical protein
MANNGGLVAIFAFADDLRSALLTLKAGSYQINTVFSPIPLPGVQEILETRPSTVRIATFIGALLGALGVMAIAVYSHLSFRFITGGKPVLPWIPWVVVCFEGAVLGAVVFCVGAWIFKGRLPRLRTADGYDVRFSRDRFGILVSCSDETEKEVKVLLENAGAEEVRRVVR